MDQTRFLMMVKYMLNAYNKDFSDEVMMTWYEEFKNDDYDTFKKAIKQLISTSNILPSIAQIKGHMVYNGNKNLQLKAEEEWEKVKYAIRQYGFYKKDKAYDMFCEITKEVVNNISWNRLCEATIDELIWIKKEFINIFDGKQDSFKEYAINGLEMLNNDTILELDYEEEFPDENF